MDVKHLLLDALKRLLASRSIDEISVAEIVEAAGVGRSTFYKHYLDKYDLLQKLFIEMCGDACGHVWETEHSYSKVALAFLEYTDANKELMRNAFRSTDVNSLRESYGEMAKSFLEQALRYGGADLSGSEIKLLIEVYIRGTASLVADWIMGKIEIPRKSFIVFQARAMPVELRHFVD